MQGRAHLATINESLRGEYINLKIAKDDLVEHIAALIKRQKKLSALKVQLTDQLAAAEENAKIQKRMKAHECAYIKEQIRELEKKHLNESIKVKNLQNEYQLCLEEYDKVLMAMTNILQTARSSQNELIRLRQSDKTMRGMIYDCERLKRVLEQQKRYFKELNNSHEKSHGERINQLQKIKKKLLQEQSVSSMSYQESSQKIGLIKISMLFNKRILDYAELFLRFQNKNHQKLVLGVKTFENLLTLSKLKQEQTLRKYYTKWNHNSFEKDRLSYLVEQALALNIKTKLKLRTWNAITMKIESSSLGILHLYQKVKYIMLLYKGVIRKDMHYGFGKWRDAANKSTVIKKTVQNVFIKTIPRIIMRKYFRQWVNGRQALRILDTANLLLEQVETGKQIARVFRKWRLQLGRIEQAKIKEYLHRLKLLKVIASRISYEKRKGKVLGLLTNKMTMLQMRNYFVRYWKNAKKCEIAEIQKQIIHNREQFSDLRKLNSKKLEKYTLKDEELLKNIFLKFIFRAKVNQVFKKWQNQAISLAKQKRQLKSLLLRKDSKIKTIIMNEFRKCVQYHEKRQMHKVLTDLNHKMEEINEKSTNFREKLKQCTENLGNIASANVFNILSYTVNFQRRLLYDKQCSSNIAKMYRKYVMTRLFTIFEQTGLKRSYNTIKKYIVQAQVQKQSEQKCLNYIKHLSSRRVSQCFFKLRQLMNKHKSGMSKCIHVENAMIFYRMTAGFNFIRTKSIEEQFKRKYKIIADLETTSSQKKNNQTRVVSIRKQLESQLQSLLSQAINYQFRNARIKKQKQKAESMRNVFNKIRNIVKQTNKRDRIMQNLFNLVEFKNYEIFWKALLCTSFEKQTQQVKQQLAKINKKRKSLDQKVSKGSADTYKKTQSEQLIHAQHSKYYESYLKRYNDILEFFEKRHHKEQARKFYRQIFAVWKRQVSSVKSIFNSIQRVLNRHYMSIPLNKVMVELKKYESQERSHQIMMVLFERKCKNVSRDSLIIWRCNVNKIKIQKIKQKSQQNQSKKQELKQQFKQKSDLISREVVRVKNKTKLIKIFMHLKNYYQTQKKNRHAIRKFKNKSNQRKLLTCMKGLKWLMFHKSTKRRYLKFTSDRYNYKLKKDVFLSLKIHREQIYSLLNKTCSIYQNLQTQVLRYSCDKIINYSAHERNDLNYQRRRILRKLVKDKQTRIKLIKRKILWKWNSWLIEKSHYLTTVLKQVEKQSLKRAFSRINEYKYWNDHYVKNMADEITSQGYAEINTATNGLVRQGCDPDEIKQFLKKRNDKDLGIIGKVIGHFRFWARKQDQVRAFHSWKQYLQLKKQIKQALTKVLNISGGLGKYMSRWRAKDAKFNNILKKQSRTNMLERYRDLSRLLKEYKRDINESVLSVNEIKQINQEYKSKNREGLLMGCNVLSNSIKKGMRQGLLLWKSKLKIYEAEKFDKRYDKLTRSIEELNQYKNNLGYRLAVLKQQNMQMKEKCGWGVECGRILENLLSQKDELSINLADKEHNMKLLLEDNLRLKQKINLAKDHAMKLINKVVKQNQSMI